MGIIVTAKLESLCQKKHVRFVKMWGGYIYNLKVFPLQPMVAFELNLKGKLRIPWEML